MTFDLNKIKYRIMGDDEVTEKKREWEPRDKEQQEKSQRQQHGREGFAR